MGAQRANRTKTPFFTATVDAEVSIDPEELESAGWVYVGADGDGGSHDDAVLDRVQVWHDRTHVGPWRWCTHELCDEIRRDILETQATP